MIGYVRALEIISSASAPIIHHWLDHIDVGFGLSPGAPVPVW